jgi:hypothetical protein
MFIFATATKCMIMKKLTIPLLVFCAVSIPFGAWAQFKIPKGYSELSISPVNGGMIKKTAAFLDGDEKEDYATLISLKDKPTEDVMLLVYLSKTKEQQIIRLNPIDEKEIFVYPLRVVNKHLEFAYGMKGDKNFARYIRVGYDKESSQPVLTNYEVYFKHEKKAALRTYNLLSGEYKINFTDLDPASNKIERNAKFGKQPLPLVSLKDYSDDFLQQLDAVLIAKEKEIILAEKDAKPTKRTKGSYKKKKK